jgi:arabinan endo-1,5-alpha-L-arabinosidase
MEYGSWTDHGATGIASASGKPYNAIDANLIQVGSAYYMNFGSFWGDIYQAPLTSSATGAASSSYQIAYQPSGTHPQEGSFMYYRSPYYYLFWSEGICCGYDTSKPASGAEYKIRVCRSSSATGGFVDSAGTSCTNGGGTTVLASHDYVYGPGGQGVFADSKHGTVLYYPYGKFLGYLVWCSRRRKGLRPNLLTSQIADTNIGLADADYQFGWNVVSWSTGWPVV